MIERSIEHYVDARAVRCGNEIGKFHQGTVARIALAHQRHDLEEILHGIRTADFVRLAGIGIGLAAIDSLGMDWLKPEPVDAEVLKIIQVEPGTDRVIGARTGTVPQINKCAPIRLVDALGFDIERVQLINDDLARLFRRDHDRMIAPAIARVPQPVGVAGNFVARSQAIGAGFLRVECQRVLAGLAARRHSVRFVIVIIVAGDDPVSVGRQNAVFDAVPIGILRGAFAPIEIGEDLRSHDVGGVRRKQNRQRDGIRREFVHE